VTSVTVVVPGIVVLVGPAGVGKSTFAARHFRPDEILSSDEFRGAIRGDPTDQTVTRVAFRILHRELAKRLADGRLVVVDATNLTRAARLALLRAARPTRVRVIAVVLVAPAAVVHARNAERGSRTVPPEVVDRHLAATSALGETEAEIEELLRAEGFHAVHVVPTGDLAADDVTFVRVRRPPIPP
jgi:protein phosphatase